jgi:phosphate starvation-inducible PhoH-like protein
MSKERIDRSPVVPQAPKLKDQINIKNFEFAPFQKEFIDLIFNKQVKIIFLNGPAGTTKTFLSVYSALKMLNDKKISRIVYIRNVVESSSKSLGALPGTLDEKIQPFMIPLYDKLEEFLSKDNISYLFNKQYISGICMSHLRGTNFNAQFLIMDEAQNADFKELTTVITRIGKFSKLIVLGDSRQSDINGKSGFSPMMQLFNDEESKQNGIYCINFGPEHVMRSEVVKFILNKLDNYHRPK